MVAYTFYGLIAAQAQYMVTIINSNITQSISEANYQRNLIFTVSLVGLIVVSLLVWFQILSKLREIHNNLKKVLQMLPLRLILSSTMLKIYLKKTSRNDRKTRS